MNWRYRTALVLESGGDAGMACLKRLRELRGCRIVAADTSRYVAASRLADAFYEVPPGTDSTFLDAVTAIIRAERIDGIMPTFEHGHEALKGLTEPVILDVDLDAAQLCKDKYELYQRFSAADIRSIPSVLLGDAVWEGVELYGKPRFGSGGRNHFRIGSASELDQLKNLLAEKDYLAQPFITGQEWAADVLVLDGFVKAVATRRNVYLQGSRSICVEVVPSPKLESLARRVQKAIKIASSFHMEVFEDSNGEQQVIEVNVRFGGGIICTALAGHDQPAFLVTGDRRYLEMPKPMCFTRYMTEIVF